MQVQLPAALELALTGVSAAALQLAVGHALAIVFGYASSPLRAIGRWLIDLLPGRLVDLTIALVEGADKFILLSTLILLWLGSAGLASMASGPEAAAVVLALLGALGIVASLRRPELPRVQAVIVATVTATVGPVAVVLFAPAICFAATVTVLLVAAILKVARGRCRQARSAKVPAASTPLGDPREGTRLPIAGITPLITPTELFYVTDVTFPPPQIDPRTWSLLLTGLVAEPLRLSFQELVALPSVEMHATLICVHNPVGGHRIGTSRWRGVPLAALLERVGVRHDAAHILAHSVDGYAGGMPLALLDRGFQPLVVYEMNGELLNAEHGAPVRLLVPGIYGYDANVKWLQRLELTTFELARDYWERKGWPRDPAFVKTQSRIDVPRAAEILGHKPQMVGGVAWSPPRGVTRVELSIDNGPWQVCELADELSPSSWRQWQYCWDTTPGPHTLRVRAWSPDGVQIDGEGAPFPRGAAGYHLIAVTVTERDGARRDTFGEFAALVRGRIRLARAGLRAWRSGASEGGG